MRHPQATKEQAAGLYAQGFSVSEIVRQMGLPMTTVHQWVSLAGLARLQRRRKDPEIREQERARTRTPEARRRNNKRRQTPEYREWQNKYGKERRATDAAFRVLHLMRTRTNKFLRGTSKSARTEELLGISALELTQRWDVEYGPEWRYNRDLHIDHIRPCMSFDPLDPVQQRLCFNYRNLQILPKAENQSKRDLWTAEMELAWAARMRELGWEGKLFLVFGP